MASKRMKNRVYWAHVKAQSYAFKVEPDVVKRLRRAYHYAFKAKMPDNEILQHFGNDILAIEDTYGPAGLRNVHNRDLWPVREPLAMSGQ